MRRSKDRKWLGVAVLTLITAVIWVGVSAAATFRKTTVSQEVEMAIRPLDPSLDQSVFEKLAGRAKGVVKGEQAP